MTKPDDTHHDDPHMLKHGRVSFGRRLRNYFLTGLVIVMPITITIYLTLGIIRFIDDRVKPLIPKIYNPDTYLPFDIPGVGLIFAVTFIIVLGFLTATLLGRSLVQFGENIVSRTPFISTIYNGSKQILQTVVSQSNTSFKTAGLIEYPRPGLWAIVFLSTDAKGEVADKLPDNDLVSVFLPTTPNPTSGFLLYVPRAHIQILDMSVEDAAKLVISAGLVMPEVSDDPAVQEKAASKKERTKHLKIKS